MLPIISHLLDIHLSPDLHLKIRQLKGKEFRGGRGSVCVSLFRCVFMSFVKVCMKRKSVYVWAHEGRDYRAAISNSFCFVIQERFGTLEGGSAHTNAEDTQTGLIDGEYEL